MTPQVRLAAGFNPGFVDGSVPIPDDVETLEIGAGCLAALRHACFAEGRELSLHLSRVPMCDPVDEQELFLERISTYMGSDIHTVGVHFCGPLREGMGRLGLGASFHPTSANRARSLRFLERLREVSRVPVLVENANLYPRSAEELAEVGAFTKELVDSRDFGVILDLAHLEMAAFNTGISPAGLLEASPAPKVVHLSGYHRRGAWMHDGHDAPVAESTWNLFRRVMTSFGCEQVVLEHTDLSWRERVMDLEGEWCRLRRELEAPRTPDALEESPSPGPRTAPDELAFALGYLSRIVLPARFPALVDAVGSKIFSALVRAWSHEFLAEPERARIAYVHDGALVADLADSVAIIEDFQAFALRWCRGEIDAYFP